MRIDLELFKGDERKIIIEKFLNHKKIRINQWFNLQNRWKIDDNRASRKVISIIPPQFLRGIH